MHLRTLIASTKGEVVSSLVLQAEGAIRPAASNRSVMVVLPVVLPEAHRTDLEVATPGESSVATARARETPSRLGITDDRILVQLPAVVIEPAPTSREFIR